MSKKSAFTAFISKGKKEGSPAEEALDRKQDKGKKKK